MIFPHSFTSLLDTINTQQSLVNPKAKFFVLGFTLLANFIEQTK